MLFWDITLPCYFRVHRAGSQLKTPLAVPVDKLLCQLPAHIVLSPLQTSRPAWRDVRAVVLHERLPDLLSFISTDTWEQKYLPGSYV